MSTPALPDQILSQPRETLPLRDSRRRDAADAVSWAPGDPAPGEATDCTPGPARTACLGLQAGTEPVAGYRLVARLGGGGSGEVWRALGPGGFSVALKFIPLGDRDGVVDTGASDGAELRALERVREIRHAHLLAIFGAWQLDECLVVGMELADRTLLDRCEEVVCQGLQGIPFPELIEYMWQAARGIDYLNEPRHTLEGRTDVGILHGDIKPHNLLLLGNSIKLGDFGLATLLDGTMSAAQKGMTPAYAAPEVFAGQRAAQSDQYSLAVTYCRLRGGRLPFNGNQWEVILRHCLDAPNLTMLPAAERRVVARALAKEPAERWPDCRAFVRALQESSLRPATWVAEMTVDQLFVEELLADVVPVDPCYELQAD